MPVIPIPNAVPERSRAPESGVNRVRDSRGGGDPDEPPESACRRRTLTPLRLSEVAESLSAVSLSEGGPADDKLSLTAQGGDFGVLASLRPEEFLELVQQIPLEFEPRRVGREVALVQPRAVAGVLVPDRHG